MQRDMLLASLRAPASGAYILQRLCQSAVRLDPGLLRDAWARVMRRHPALRCSIVLRDAGSPALRIEESPDPPWNLRDHPPENLEAFLKQDRESGFTLQDGVPMRFALWHGPAGSSLLWTVHHALLDGRSVAIVWRELFTIYDALRTGDAISLPDAPDFRRQLDWLERRDFTRSEPFWRRQFQNISATTGHIADRLHSGVLASEPFAKEGREGDESLTAGLETFARTHGLTVNTLVLAAWALVLSRYSGRDAVVFGVTRSCRRTSVPDALEMVGPLMNTLPFRLTVDREMPLLSFLQHVRREWQELAEHEHTPLEQVRGWSGLPAGMPPYESVLVYDREPIEEGLRKLGPAWRDRRFPAWERTDAPLTLAVYGRPRISLQIVYDTALFCRETIAPLAGHLEQTLRSFLDRPVITLQDVRMLPGTEETRILVDWNSRNRAAPNEACAHHLFEQQAERSPRNVALESGGRTVSYGEANRRANQLACWLRERGIGREDIVAIRLAASPESVIAALGILKAGAAFLPLDSEWPAARIAAMIEHAAPKCVLEDWDSLVAQFDSHADPAPPSASLPGDAAYVVFTSGSTGTPKAVVVTHRSLVNHTRAVTLAEAITETDRRLQFVPMGSDVWISEIFNTLSTGATLVFGRSEASASMAAYLRFLERNRITMTGMPSSWWREWVKQMEAGTAVLPSSLRVVVSGMEAVDREAFRGWKRVAGDRVRWFNAYGPTEATIVSLLYEAGSSEWENGRHIPIGRPIANARAYALDDCGRPVPAGMAGELYIGGAGVARGYLGDDRQTAAKFPPDPFGGPEDRLYRTGDLVFALPDGNFVFLGRVDRQVKIRGFRVELEEVEAVLARHPAVRHAGVVADASGRLKAYLSWRGESGDIEDVRRHTLRHLPGYMVPHEFFQLATLPLTASGKIDYAALPNDVAPARSGVSLQAPSTETEKRLAPLWKSALSVPAASSTDDFFAAGGDSLRATALIGQIAREFGKELSIHALRRSPTFAAIAALLESEGPAAVDHAPMVWRPEADGIPFFAVSSDPDDAPVFAPLADCLTKSRPFVVLPNPIGIGPSSVEDLAAVLCRRIREIRPHGPYALGGFCFGGLVAYEAARQLIEDGETVRLVALFDTQRPGFPRFLGVRASAWRRLLVRLRFLAPLHPASRSASTVIQAARSYKPRPLPVPMIQFLTRTQPAHWRFLGDPRLQWASLLAPAEFRVHALGGSHAQASIEQHRIEIATVLSSALDS